MLSTVTSKGQITVPKKFRDMFGIHSHDKVELTAADDHIILKPVQTLRELRGSVKAAAGEQKKERTAAKQAVGKRVVDEMT